jgi:predicted anti-sigma-YlaC factor YlaD
MGCPVRFRIVAGAAALGVLLSPACSIRKFAVRKLGDALASAGTTYASDDDPELVRDAVPFALKTIEGLLAEVPDHLPLLLAATSGFTQYGYGFVQQDADAAEDVDLEASRSLRQRARRLFVRARDYGLRGLDVLEPGTSSRLRTDPREALAFARGETVPLLYWTAAAWAAALSNGKDDLDLLADQGAIDALLRRAEELDPEWGEGALLELRGAFDAGRSEAAGGSRVRARSCFVRAAELSGGNRASAFVGLAESVSVPEQRRKEFDELLTRALAVDVDRRPEWRLANLVAQRRARWLLSRTEALFY